MRQALNIELLVSQEVSRLTFGLISLPRVIYFKFPLLPHQKYYIQ